MDVLLPKVKKDHALLHAYSRLTYQRLIHLDQSLQVQESLHHLHDCAVSTQGGQGNVQQRGYDEHCHKFE